MCAKNVYIYTYIYVHMYVHVDVVSVQYIFSIYVDDCAYKYICIIANRY